MYRYARYLLVFVLPCVLQAQQVPSRRYTSRDGIFTDRITKITQDRNGYLWLGTYFGVIRYDGYQFQRIELPEEAENRFVTSIVACGDKVYAGFLFNGGLVEFDRKKITGYVLPKIEGRDPGAIFLLYPEGDSSLLVVTSTGHVFRFRHNRFLHLAQFENVGFPSAIERDGGNRIWIGGEKGLVIYDEKQGTAQHLFKGQYIFCLKSMDRQMVTVATDSTSVARFYRLPLSPGERKTLEPFFVLDHFGYGNSISVTESGFWITHPKKGLGFIGMDGRSQYYKTNVHMASDIRCIFSDREKNIWVANDPGVVKISNPGALSYLFEEGAPTDAFIYPMADKILVTNSKQLYSVRDDSMKRVLTAKAGNYYNKIIATADGTVWLGRWSHGVWKMKWEGDRVLGQELIDFKGERLLEIRNMVKAADSSVWMVSPNQIYRLTNNRLQRLRITNPHPILWGLVCLAVDEKEKALWIGHDNRGVYKFRYSGEAPEGMTVTLVDSLDAKKGLMDLNIRSILLDHSGNLWIGTRNKGLYRFRDVNGHQEWRSFGHREGILCSRISAIIENGKDLFAASCDGVYQIRNEEIIRHFTTGDGLLGNDVFHIAIEGQFLWAASTEGVTRLPLKTEEPVPPGVIISGISILGVSDTTAMHSGHYVIPSQKNSIGFHFTANSFIDEKQVTYRYQLKGFDRDWSAPTRSNSIHYASLPAGTYTFLVRAQNARGVWSREAASFSFTITFPFYRRAWFWILVVSLLVISAFMIRQYRLRQKLKMQQLRLNIARDLHDDIGSALGSINILSQTAQRRRDRATGYEDILSKISTTAQETLESMDDIVWTINPEKDRFSHLVMRMTEFARPLMEAQGIGFCFEHAEEGDAKLDMETRRHLFLIFKEAINNILKHSGCTEVYVTLDFTAGRLYLQIVDNGNGFVPPEESKRNGLKNLVRRAELLDADLKIESAPGSGTRLVLNSRFK